MSGALLVRRLRVLGALGLAALALGAPTAGAATTQQRWLRAQLTKKAGS